MRWRHPLGLDRAVRKPAFHAHSLDPRPTADRPRAESRDAGRLSSSQSAAPAGLPGGEPSDDTADPVGNAVRFFRDRSLWEVLEARLIPDILAEKDDESMIRVWVPGCASGEDAYTLAMLLIERCEAAGRAGEVRVFATDTDIQALAFGREGLYPASIASELTPERLRRFFVREARGFRVDGAMLRRVLFAPHDIRRDPPYPRLDLIYCPRARSSFDAEVRESIDRSFRRGLRAGGFLVRGRSQWHSAPGCGFEVVSDEWGIDRRTAWSRPRASGSDLTAIFLTRQLRVRWITPEMMRLFDLGCSDRGRSIEELATRLDDPEMPGDARATLEKGESIYRHVRAPRGRWFIRRMQPSRSGGDVPHGVVATFIDVTPLKEAEWEAREAEAYFQSIVDTIREPLVVLDADFRVRSANGSYYKAFRARPEETEGRSIRDLAGGQWEDPRLRERLERVRAEGLDLDEYLIEADGGQAGRRTLRLSARRVDGMPLVLLAIEDITERRRTAEALDESRRRLQTLFENAQDAILLADDQGRYVDANPAACESTGYSRSELLVRSVFDLTPEPDRPAITDLWNSLLQRGRLEGECQLLRKDGSLVTLEFRAVAHILPGLHLSVLHDITERKRLEKEVLQIAAAEQHRIGQELHDDAGQVLTGLSLMAGFLADRLEASSPEGRIAARIVDGIGDVLDKVRRVAKGLIPVEVAAGGLMAALAELAFQTDGLNGIACRFECAEPVIVRDNTTATELHRIAQEAITNAVRHGHPRNIGISMEREQGRIHLEIRDDGEGLPEPLDERAGRGLRIMRHRASLVGATLSVGRGPEGGTVVRCVFSEDDRHV